MISIVMTIIIAVVCAVLFAVLGFLFGYTKRGKSDTAKIGDATEQATKILNKQKIYTKTPRYLMIDDI